MVLGLVCPQASFATTTASASLSPASVATTVSQQDLSSSEDSVGLPTLLASRLTAVGHAPDATKKRGRVRPTLVTEQLPSAADQDIRCIVRNTFIEYRGIDLMSPLAEGNRRTREPMTCPASRVGRMNSLFEDTPNTIEFAPLEDIPPSPLPWRETPKTPSPEGALLPAAGQSSLSSDAAVFVPGLCQHYGEAAAAAGTPSLGPLSSFVLPPAHLGHAMQHQATTPAPPPPPRPAVPLVLAPALPPAPPLGYAPHTAASDPPCAPPPFSPRSAARPCLVASSPQQLGTPPPACPAPAAADLPSAGSYLHGTGACKPCLFMHTRGCENGLRCSFCHMCEPGEKKRRQKERQAITKKLVAGAVFPLPVVEQLPLQPLQNWFPPAR